MTKTVNDYNVFKMTEKQLKQNVKEIAYNRILNKLVEDFKVDIEPIIKKEVDKIVIESAEHIRDFLTLKEELHVYVTWDKPKESN